MTKSTKCSQQATSTLGIAHGRKSLLLAEEFILNSKRVEKEYSDNYSDHPMLRWLENRLENTMASMEGPKTGQMEDCAPLVDSTNSDGLRENKAIDWSWTPRLSIASLLKHIQAQCLTRYALIPWMSFC